MTHVRTAAALALALVALVALAGCGATVGGKEPVRMSGQEVSVTAEKALEKQAGVSKGTMTCGSLDAVVDDSTRCERVVVDNDSGIVVKLGVTVTVTKSGRPAHLHVQADKAVREFGLTGESIAADLKKQYAAQQGVEPDAVQCPYLEGVVGKQVLCKLTADGDTHDVQVTVDRVDAKKYDTHYTYRMIGQ